MLAPARSRRQREHEVRRPSPFSAQTRAPFASAKPRAIARPSPAPRDAVAAALERLEHRLALRRPTPGPSSSDVHEQLAVRGSTRTRTGVAAGEKFSALSSRFTSTRSICAASTCTGGASASSSSHDALAAGA